MNSRYKKIKRFLEQDNFNGFTSKDLFIKNFKPNAWGHDIAALSNMAEALRNLTDRDRRDEKSQANRDEAIQLLDRVVKFAMHPGVNPWKKPFEQVRDFNHFGYYLEHLNIILGCYQSVADNKYHSLNERITRYLCAESVTQPNAHARLIPHIKMRWSADQAAIIYSIWLYDKNNGTKHHIELRDRWLAYMENHGTHPETGLFITEVMGTKRYSKQPRGCSHAYMCYYMEYFAYPQAREQWQLFKQHMGAKLFGISGFREYLPNYKGKWTPDSGPIISGMGVAATGLALKPVRVWGEEFDSQFERLFYSARLIYGVLNLIKFVPLLGRLALLGSDLLATSVILAAETTQQKYI